MSEDLQKVKTLLKVRGCSGRTVTTYISCINRFKNYFEGRDLEDLNEGEYTLTKTDNLTGTTDTEVQARAKDFEGFTFDDSIDGTKLSGNIDGNGNLVLKIYYKIDFKFIKEMKQIN